MLRLIRIVPVNYTLALFLGGERENKFWEALPPPTPVDTCLVSTGRDFCGICHRYRKLGHQRTRSAG